MERRSTFRFRLPWSQPASAPAPSPAPTPASRPATQPNNRTTRPGTRSQTASQPSNSNTPITTPSSSPKTETPTRNQPPSTNTTTTSTKPSSLAQPSAGSTQARNKASTSTTTPTPRSSTPPPKPSAVTNASSQPSTTSTSPLPETTPIPPQTSAESKGPIQSSTNTNPLTETSTVPPQPSAESKAPIQPSTTISKPGNSPASPKSSPTRTNPQVLSTDQITSKSPSPANQASSNVPSGITSPMQLKDQTIAQPTSAPKQLQESSEPSSKSTETLPSISGKEPRPTAIQPQSEQMELLKKETRSDKVAEAKVRSPEKVMQPSEVSAVKSIRGTSEGPSQISDSSGIIGETNTVRNLVKKIQETKEVKEVVQETKGKNYGAGEKSGGFSTSKEQPINAFHSKQGGSENDKPWVNPVYIGKQTSKVSPQLKNKPVVGGSSKEAAVSAEPDIPLNKEIKDNISKFIHRMAVQDGKQNLEGPVTVITLAGDNRGASVQLGTDSSKKKRAVHIHRGYKLNPDGSADATTDAEGSSEGRQPKDAKTTEDQEIEAYLNCNVQGLNNSITFDSSISGKNPGIHMLLPRMPSEPIKSSDRTGTFEAHKAEFNVTPARKLTYEPTIRRRCLKDLFPELSDSDTDDPEEPRRVQHSRDVGCMKKSKDNEIDIL